MNTDKAYILGLLVGGGCFSSDTETFFIKLPYKSWGKIDKNPQRAGDIAKDIIQVVKPVMLVEYGIDVSYEIGYDWRIVCSGDISPIKKDLAKYGIMPSAELHKTADISKLVNDLEDATMKKRFIAGIADTIGSMAPSHRRFSDDVQIISFEISGFNYKLVCELCRLLYSLGCVPDQILWQLPNMQSGTDSYYKSWKKGNKLRVTLDSFDTFGSMAFRSKSKASIKNRKLEKEGTYNAAYACEKKSLSVPGVVARHTDENYKGIPSELRGGHFIHHKQVCAALHCDHAPCKELDRLFSSAEKYVSPFTVLTKGDAVKIADIIKSEKIMADRTYTDATLGLKELLINASEGAETVLFINGIPKYCSSRRLGYPVSVILDAVNFVVASKTGNLNGNRPRGSRKENLENALKENPSFSVSCRVPDLPTPLVITDGKVSALVGALNEKAYKSLISFDKNNKYKMYVRPATENDLK